MHRDGSFLRIDARSEHGGRAENNPYLALVHRVDNGLARLVGLALLDEANLRGGNTVILHELAFDFAVHVELRSTLLLLGRGNKFPLPSLNRRGPLPRLKRPQIREDELRSFLRVVLAVVFCNHTGAVARFVVCMVVVVRVDQPHVERHLAGVVRCDQHLGLVLRFGERRATEYRRVARLGELHQLFDELLLLWRGRDVVEHLVLVGAIHADVLRRAVVGNLGVERRQLRDFDEVAEALFLHDVVRYRELEISGFLGEDRRPRIERVDILPFQLFWAQVFEQQVQLRQRVADGRARQERRAQILARALLYGADGIEHIERLLTAVLIAQPRHTVVARVEHQVFELVALVHEDMVDAHLLEVHHVVRARLDGVGDTLQLHGEVDFPLFQTPKHRSRNILALPAQHLQILLHRV